MRRLSFRICTLALPAILLGACNAGAAADPLANLPAANSVAGYSIPQWQAQNLAHRACPEAGPGVAQCELLILNKSRSRQGAGMGAPISRRLTTCAPRVKGSGAIVAVIDAYDNPNVASDLAAYRRHYGLPKAKFYKYNQDGRQSHYPEGNIALGPRDRPRRRDGFGELSKLHDLSDRREQHFLSNSIRLKAEAVRLGAHITSNSFGYAMSGLVAARAKLLETPGVTYVAARGTMATAS